MSVWVGQPTRNIGFNVTVNFKMSAFRYTHAVVCRIPHSLQSKYKDINIDEAIRQHEIYVRLLRELGLDVIELPPDPALPECVFVEDTAVVCNGTALITWPSAPDRYKEVLQIHIKSFVDVFMVFIRNKRIYNSPSTLYL